MVLRGRLRGRVGRRRNSFIKKPLFFEGLFFRTGRKVKFSPFVEKKIIDKGFTKLELRGIKKNYSAYGKVNNASTIKLDNLTVAT